MKVNKRFIIILAVILVIFAGFFYWYEYRPNKIRQECTVQAREMITSNVEKDISIREEIFGDYLQLIQLKYELCIHERGLEK